ncbi:MAG: cysteine desulfurase [Planctomycetes bacterium]|nr:cysteine desulfurase [Planctomycetota bacterium]MCP4838288.1 cysteine desulfurase [Planctomycetota bacterium]
MAIRDGIPALSRDIHGKPLIYLDNAATTPRPQAVLDTVLTYESQFPANVHRGVHTLSGEATHAYEDARRRIAAFFGGGELVFTRGTTEAINLVAGSWGETNLGAGDEVLISALEHHANIVPWQLLCARRGCVLRVADVDDAGELHLDTVIDAMTDRTRLLAMTGVSNALGTVTPIAELCATAKARGITTLVDGAQMVPHMPVDITAIGCDFFVFSGHKMYAPTGIGGLLSSGAQLEAMPPWQGGGDMIRSVSFADSTWNDVPWKFEAGTPNVGGTIGLGGAVDWLSGIGMDTIANRETALLADMVTRLKSIDRVQLVGTPSHRAGAISFVIDGMHPADVGAMLDRHSIAIRAGHHCAQPILERLGYSATARIAPAFFNTEAELEATEAAIRRIIDVFG